MVVFYTFFVHSILSEIRLMLHNDAWWNHWNSECTLNIGKIVQILTYVMMGDQGLANTVNFQLHNIFTVSIMRIHSTHLIITHFALNQHPHPNVTCSLYSKNHAAGKATIKMELEHMLRIVKFLYFLIKSKNIRQSAKHSLDLAPSVAASCTVAAWDI